MSNIIDRPYGHKEKILIVVDAQNDFITGSLGSAEAEDVVLRIVNKINNHDEFIVATFDTHPSREYPKTLEYKYLPIAHCTPYLKG